MNEAKFTKGLWVALYPYEILNSGHVSVEIELGQCIYTIEAHKSNLEERTANAHLIAAAPDMYAFIERLIEPFTNVESMLCEVDSLLAKARGEL